jgi:hypothetical protein
VPSLLDELGCRRPVAARSRTPASISEARALQVPSLGSRPAAQRNHLHWESIALRFRASGGAARHAPKARAKCDRWRIFASLWPASIAINQDQLARFSFVKTTWSERPRRLHNSYNSVICIDMLFLRGKMEAAGGESPSLDIGVELSAHQSKVTHICAIRLHFCALVCRIGGASSAFN